MIKKKNKNNNFSPSHKLYLKKIKRDKAFVLSGQILLLVAILGLWELFTSVGILDPFFFSSPSRIIATLGDFISSGELLTHIGITLYETLLGFIIATVLGSLIAILLWWSEKLRRILDPYIVVLNALPKIALGPMIVIWFGIGTTSIIVMCILICIIITTISMLNAFLACDKDKIQLMRSMGANKLQILFKLILPSALGDFISVLKINVGMSWVGTIMGEYLSSKAGLGYLIVYGGQVFKLDLVMTATLILCVLAGGMYFIVARIEARFKKWFITKTQS